MKQIFLLSIMLLFSACEGESADERLDAGYSDGYAVGYNTECKIRTTLIEGDFDNADYSRGYYAGLADGAAACRRDK